MKKTKNLFLKIHRFSASFLSLMFVIWFFSGIVLIFAGFPHASREKRFLHLQEFEAKDFRNLQAPLVDFKGKIALELCNNKPVYRIYKGGKKQTVYDAQSLDIIPGFSQSFAKSLSESYTGMSVEKIELQTEFDQWIPWSYYKPLLPFYKCIMNDADNTIIYISTKTGEIIQKTTRTKRVLAWLGAIPHWIYFKSLRLQVEKWKTVVITLSLLGLIVSISGIYIGIKMALIRRRKRKLTPYKRFLYKWHHLLGFFFGFFVFTFLLSGLFSVYDLPEWIAGINKDNKTKIKWNQSIDLKKFKELSPNKIYQAVKRKKGIRKITWHTVFNEPQIRIYYENYRVPELYTLQDTNLVALSQYSIEKVSNYAKEVLGNTPFKLDLQTASDYYYMASAMYYLPCPAYKITIEDEEKTWLYINPSTGEIAKKLTKQRRISRWIYRALHTFDFLKLSVGDIWRQTLLVILSLAGFIISLTGLILSTKWFKRKWRNYSK